MKKIIIGLFSLLFIIACKKEESVDTQIANYIADNNLTVETSTTGLRYYIENEGEGDFPISNSILKATYKVSKLNGEVLMQSNELGDFYVTSNIAGLEEGLRKLKKNGTGTFIIPPSLSYIPPGDDQLNDEVLVYEISVDSIDNHIQDEILTYLSDNNLTAEETPEGLFYIIDEPGGTEKPSINNTVRVNYVGQLTNGEVFDESSNPVNFPLRNLIRAWQYGIPLIGEGGTIRLICPPQLGYGPNAQGVIPENAVLIFDIDLLAF